MNDEYLERLGRIIKNTYDIKNHEPYYIGKLIRTTYLLLAEEEMRDNRERINKMQYDEDWQSNDRDRAVSQNGNVGYE